MGSNHSTEGVVHSSLPGSLTPSFTPTMSNNAINIPAIPGWDGVAISTQNMHVEIELKSSWSGTETSTEAITQTIMAQAKAGYRLSAVFLPVFTVGKEKGQLLDGYRVGFRTQMGRVMCIFQKDLHYQEVPLETMFLRAPMTFNAVMSSSPMEVSGYQGLYGQLQQSGTHGYALSCVLDEPNTRVRGLTSQETSVHLICQKPQMVEATPVSQYLILNCNIELQRHFTKMSASMPGLTNLLSAYTTQCHKISSVYNPPTVSLTGFSSSETQCHIILEKTPLNYYFTVCDVPFEVQVKFGGTRTVDHSQYLTYISAYSNNGWQLAGLIDMPDMQREGMMTFSSTIKMIFQAPAPVGSAGGYLGHPGP